MAVRLVVGTEQPATEGGDLLLEVGAGEAFVGDHDLAACEEPLEQLGRDEPFGRVGRREFEADRQPVRGGEQVEPEAPEPVVVRAAVAVAADPCQRAATDGLPRGRTRHRCRVEQPQPVAEAGRKPRKQAERLHELRRQSPQPFVEARLARDVGKEMTEPLTGKAQEATLVGAVQNICATARQINWLSEIRGGRPERRLAGRRSSTST